MNLTDYVNRSWAWLKEALGDDEAHHMIAKAFKLMNRTKKWESRKHEVALRAKRMIVDRFVRSYRATQASQERTRFDDMVLLALRLSADDVRPQLLDLKDEI